MLFNGQLLAQIDKLCYQKIDLRDHPEDQNDTAERTSPRQNKCGILRLDIPCGWNWKEVRNHVAERLGWNYQDVVLVQWDEIDNPMRS
jgi:hypothetical protein